MKYKCKIISKYLFLGIVGSIMYMLIEIIFRGYTFITMGLAGMVAFILIGLINEILSWEVPLYLQMVIGSYFITVLEYIIGSILLNSFSIRMWNYSDQWLNVNGIICPLFSFIWLWVSLVAILLDGYLRWKIFNEEKPRYFLF